MTFSLIWFVACSDLGAKPGADDTSDTGAHTGSGDTGGETGTDSAAPCEEGGGILEGHLLQPEGGVWSDGEVALLDEAGATDLVADPVNDDGVYHLVYGPGDYNLQGRRGACISDLIPFTFCGSMTYDVTLECAP